MAAGTNNTNGRNVAVNVFPLLLLLVLTSSNDPTTRLKVVEAFVTPGGRSGMTQSSPNVRQNGEQLASPLLRLLLEPTRKNSFHLYSTQHYQEQQQQQQKPDHDDEDPNDNNDKNENSVAKRLLLDAERLRLEAEQMDAALKDKVAEKEMKEKKEKAAPAEFSPAALSKMDAATCRRLLDERGLPTSGKLEKLRERLGAVKRGN